MTNISIMVEDSIHIFSLTLCPPLDPPKLFGYMNYYFVSMVDKQSSNR